MATKRIETIEQARAAVASIRSKAVIDHHETIEANNIESAIEQVGQWEGLIETERLYDSQGNVTLRDQAARQRGEWEDTRMTPLAKTLAGIDHR